jgi:DNA primase
LQLLRQENVATEHALRLGLVGERAPRQYREKFFARLMFPIANAAGKIVAFGGRVLDNALPKYLNSSETPLFHKRSTLYGLHQAKESIRKADRVVVVEGYLDVIALAQHELSYAVATLGTALTVDHIRLLSRYTKNVIALFDGDDAGQKAAARSFEVFVEAGLLGRAAFLPKQDDPDTFVRQHGKTRLELILDEAVPLADFFFLWLERRYGKSLEGKSQIAAEVSRVLAKLNNPLEVDLLIGRAVDLLGIREETMRQRTHSPLPARTAQNRPVAPAAMPREDKAERMLIGAMLRLPKVIEQVAADEEARQGFS